jgi:tetratricopeptide (TPR) repeat protein/tRNA A-37 threonylcarbamoyl transferase component Bud32
MSPERLQRIEELYHAAREGTPEERAALLARIDPDLRREVELLLSQPSSGNFLDRPAVGNAPELLEDSTVTGLTAGFLLGPYRIETKLGEGGMGEVFRAVDTRLGRAVAIKITHEQFSARFEREARAIASLNHPNICTVHDVGANYLVMELVEGETIAARLKSGPLPMNTALAYAAQIAAALVEAHAKGIIHRDIKPGNIMISKSGVKVLDFGLAKSGRDETVTASRMMIGTPAYMSPEQREGKTADARSDIYSFGCVLYEMFTGARVSARRKRVRSRKLEGIVSRCLEEAPERRWQSAVELEQELAGVTANGSRGKLMVAVTAGMLGAFAAAAYFYFHRTPSLTDRDTIVLADFVNDTGDPIFDGTLRQGLAIQLEQSPFLKIMDDQQMQRVLRLMSLSPGARITNEVAREICVREGAAATIDGTIASLGKNYVITLQAIACQNGATLVRDQIEAPDKEHVLNKLGAAATAMRARLGESLNSIQKLNLPLEQAATGSLEALQNYTAGGAEMDHGRFRTAVPWFERAVTLDPSFAGAYRGLGAAYYNAGDTRLAAEYNRKAFGLIDRASDYERDLIVVGYYEASGELYKVIDALRVGSANYPRSWLFHNNLSEDYINLGQFEEGLKEGQVAAQLQPNVEPPYRRLLDAYMCLDRLDEAKKVAESVRALGIAAVRVHQRFLEMAYIEGDLGAAAREIQWYAGKPEEYLSFGLQAAYRNVLGQRLESSKLYKRAAETALRERLKDVAADFEDADARADALLGRCGTARRLGRPALALAMCGDTAQAEKLAAETSKLFPNGTLWNAVHLPGIRAAIELQRGQPPKAVEVLASASPYERAYPEAVYLRGMAYLRSGKGAQAAAEFGKILDHKGASWGSTWRFPYWGQYYSISYVGLARGSLLAGDTAKAKKAFQDFFELWKEAHPDIAILQQAKAEYTRLR